MFSVRLLSIPFSRPPRRCRLTFPLAFYAQRYGSGNLFGGSGSKFGLGGQSFSSPSASPVKKSAVRSKSRAKSAKSRVQDAPKSAAQSTPEIADLAGLKKLIDDMPAGTVDGLSGEVKALVQSIRAGKLDSMDDSELSKTLKEASKKARLDVVGQRFPRSGTSLAGEHAQHSLEQHEELSNLTESAAKQLLELSDDDWKTIGIEKPDFSKPLTFDKLVELDKILGNKGIKTSDFQKYLTKDELKLPEDFDARAKENPEELMDSFDFKFKEFPFIKETKKAMNKRMEALVLEQRKKQADATRLRPGDLSKSLMTFIRKGQSDLAIETFNEALTWNPKDIGFDPIDLTSINVVLSLYCFDGNLPLAMRTFDLLEKYAYKPNLTTFNAMINLASSKRDDRLLLQWYNRLLESGISPDALTFNTIISCFSQVGDAVSANKWFEEMRRLLPSESIDATPYSHMIHMHGIVLDDVPGALDWAKRMLEDGAKRNDFSAQVIGDLHRKVDATTRRKAEEARREERDTIQGQLLAAIKSGDQKEVDKIWDSIRYNRAHITEFYWSSMIAHYATIARLQDAERLFQEMQDEGFVPSRITCGVMVQVFRRMGKLDEAQDALRLSEAAPASQSPLSFEREQTSKFSHQIHQQSTSQGVNNRVSPTAAKMS